jgi:hypothetical protein
VTVIIAFEPEHAPPHDMNAPPVGGTALSMSWLPPGTEYVHEALRHAAWPETWTVPPPITDRVKLT